MRIPRRGRFLLWNLPAYPLLVEICSQLGQAGEAARAQEQLAKALNRQGHSNEALHVLEEVLSAYRLASDLEGQAQILYRIGHLHGQRGTPDYR